MSHQTAMEKVCEVWIALSGQLFMQRMQLSQLKVQYGLFLIILMALTGHCFSHNPHWVQADVATKVLAMANRPTA
jgi:hypothetical protein